MKYDTVFPEEILDNKICDGNESDLMCENVASRKVPSSSVHSPSSLRLSTVLASVRSDNVGSKLSAVIWLRDDY